MIPSFYEPKRNGGRTLVPGQQLNPFKLGTAHPRVLVCDTPFRLKGPYYLGNPRGQTKDQRKRSVLLHRVVYEKTYGPIPDGHEVHHIDEDTFNCHPDNLEAIPKFYHRSLHKSAIRYECECRVCGKRFGSYQSFAARCSDACKRADHARVERERRLVARSAKA